MEKSFIYAITMLTSLDMKTCNTRTVGWYKTKEDAEEDVKTNNCDLWETCYNYALIEKVPEGIYQYEIDNGRWLYKYNLEKQCYEPCEEPEEMKHLLGFSIG